jgi:NADH-quinone oxidoreductase subunit F
MSAAYYLVRLGYGVTVMEAMPIPGGMMAIGIPEYRLPREVLRAEIDRIVGLGVDLRLDAVMGRDFSLNDLEAQGFDAIFLSTGAPKSRRLGVPGDTLSGVIPATVFLKQVNLGERPRLGGRVVVVGGGSTAMDAARSALRSGAEAVTVLYRRGFKEMPAQAEEIDAARREGVAFRIGTTINGVVGSDGAVSAVSVVEQAPTGAVENGRAVWAAVPGSEEQLDAEAILVAIGEEPDPSILPEGAGIETSAWAGIAADPRTLATGRAGVFAGGDVVSGPKTIIDAVAAGRRAAGAIHQYLSGSTNGEADILATVRYRTPPEPSLRFDLEPRPRARAPLPVVDATSFRATQAGFGDAEARAEASRCFRCDAVYGCSTAHVLSGRGPADSPDRIHRAAPPVASPPASQSSTHGDSTAGGDR